MAEEVRKLLSNDQSLNRVAKNSFDAMDSDKSGFIDQEELYNVMVNAARSINAPQPTMEQANNALQEIDRNKDGKVSLSEFVQLLRRVLEEMLDQLESVEMQRKKEAEIEEQVNRQLHMFEKYLDDSGLAMAFQLIFAEILTKKIDANNVFTYTAMRLRQIGKEIAHLLPKDLTSQLAE
ncbi:unnamed protein product [Blepharisma stoltei]|uniref:EF-hand domain-containing protein n=1 Tax=Blepharisma stoltei TaxID=1481888 RepID=A0AAU9J334_9CILI|nr:unnamed protein product [Blepharisma stoltei]